MDIAWFEDLRKGDIGIAGGKGANLGHVLVYPIIGLAKSPAKWKGPLGTIELPALYLFLLLLISIFLLYKIINKNPNIVLRK